MKKLFAVLMFLLLFTSFCNAQFQSIHFNGSSSEGVEIPSSPSINSYFITQQFTIMTWIKISQNSRQNNIIMKQAGNCNDDFNFGISPSNKIIFAYNGGCQGDFSLTADTIFTVDRWYHIAVVLDFRVGYRTAKIFINSSLSAQAYLPTFSPAVHEIPFVIGGNRYSGGNSPSFKGNICEVQYYNKILSQSEIADRKNRWLITSSQDTIGLISYWSICGNVLDSWRYNNHGIIGGTSYFQVDHPFMSILSSPSLISPLNNSIDNSITPLLFWSTVENANLYRVQVSPSSTFSYIVDSLTTNMNYRLVPAGKLNPATTYYWRVKAINNFGESSWSVTWNFFTLVTNINENEVIAEYKLFQNYPNPFNPVTKIKYDLKNKGFVDIRLYDITGKFIKQLENTNKNSGSYSLTINCDNLASGMYYYKLTTNDFIDVKKMILIK